LFKQDLAQDLDQTLPAKDVVLNIVRQFDPTTSDEKVRSVLGSLGLMQEKSVRTVGFLSGRLYAMSYDDKLMMYDD
jgi:ATPase subunit of ABC transporter with duplicated ATPase domains